ncbi:MAG: STAS domain-containing protein [Rhodoferax sp.]|nr:STAS domain-containing protein [Rhodoferax sp.]
MTIKNDPPGLLSKMAMFVRNPTKDWSELDRPHSMQESGYDKQVLKALIERKKQNDFVRSREFDKLRKLRKAGRAGSRDAAAGATAAVGGATSRSSDISSLDTDPDGRAVTLKKIDEIEAQMSKQWWKGKQDAAAAQGAGLSKQLTDEAAQGKVASLSPSEQFAPTEASVLRPDASAGLSDFVVTQMGVGTLPLSKPAHLNQRSAAGVTQTPDASTAQSSRAETIFSTTKMSAIEVEHMNTDAELEEAAIRFANGDDVDAENGLLAALRAQASSSASSEAASAWAAALLDLYRATGNRVHFDQALLEFANRFEGFTPRWFVIGEESAAVVDAATPSSVETTSARDYASEAVWSSPSELTAQAMEDLRMAMSSTAPPWHLDWSQLRCIAADAMPLLDGLFSSLCSEPVGFRCSAASRFVDALRTLMPSGDRSVDQAWWTVRLNALRAMGMQDEFEMVALDYCVTYEVVPPPWQEARCQYENVDALQNLQNGASRGNAGNAGNDPIHALTAPIGLDGSSAITLELRGNVLGDATQALASFNSANQGGEGIIISCSGLVRVDFLAAGSILNWVTSRQTQGCRVQFRNVHRLVAAFFNVIGISEYARVVTRSV